MKKQLYWNQQVPRLLLPNKCNLKNYATYTKLFHKIVVKIILPLNNGIKIIICFDTGDTLAKLKNEGKEILKLNIFLKREF